MDDFLHNLRSGKLKQPDRGRRDYSDYKGPQRRAGNERRRPDYYAKVTSENFTLVKTSLDLLAENQKRIADAVAANEKTSTRIADALEAIAEMMGRHLVIQEVQPDDETPMDVETDEDTMVLSTPDIEPDIEPVIEVAEAILPVDKGKRKLGDKDKPRMLDIIASMRTEGKSWEKIARHIDDQNIPTVSGKGKWRGPAIKKFWDANS